MSILYLLFNQAVEQGVKLIACTMSMDVMGITKEELRDDVEYGGVGAYIDIQNKLITIYLYN